MEDKIISLKNTGRLAGFFWLLSAAAAGFSLVYVRPKLTVSGDAAATAINILANQSLFRLAIAATLFSQVLLLFFGLTAYRLFKEVNKSWVRLFLSAVLVCVAVAVVNMLNNFGVLIVLSKPDYLNAFGQEQLDALVMIFLRLSNFGQGIIEVFLAIYLFSLGQLIIKSNLVPKILGILIMIGCFGFVVNTFTKILLPDFYPAMFTQLAMLGGSFTLPILLWLLIKGVKHPPISEI